MELAVPDKLFSSTEVCGILGVSLRTLYRYIESGDLGSIQTPTGRHRFTKKHIEDFLSKGKRVTPPAESVQEEAKEAEETREISPVQESVPSEDIETKEEIVESEEAIEPIESEEASSEEGANLSLAEEEVEPELGQEELVEDIKEIYYKVGDLDVRGLAKKIKEVADKHNLKYAFTGLGGLSLHFPIKPFSNLEVYIDRDLLDLWTKELNLVEASKLAANLKVKFDDVALSSAEPLGGLTVVNINTLAEDLRSDGYDELAEELKSRNL